MAEACSLTALHGGCPSAKVCGYRQLEIENAEGKVVVVVVLIFSRIITHHLL